MPRIFSPEEWLRLREEALKLRSQGLRYKDIAERLGVSESMVHRLLKDRERYERMLERVMNPHEDIGEKGESKDEVEVVREALKKSRSRAKSADPVRAASSEILTKLLVPEIVSIAVESAPKWLRSGKSVYERLGLIAEVLGMSPEELVDELYRAWLQVRVEPELSEREMEAAIDTLFREWLARKVVEEMDNVEVVG